MNKLDIQPGMIFIAADGDDIGRKVGRAVIANDFDKLHEISSRIDYAQDLIARWTKEMGGIKISGGGDEFTAAIPKDKVEHVERLRKDIEYAFGYTISVGLGKSLSEAGRALLIAKLKGKDQIVEFTKATEIEIKAIKKRAKKGAMKSMEEYKLAEAYLNKSESDALCPYCQQTDGIDPDHCKFCHDAEMAEGAEACPFCAEMSAGTEALGEASCEFCAQLDQPSQEACPYCTSDASQEVATPGTAEQEDIENRAQQAQQIEAMGMTPPAIGKQSPELPPVAEAAPTMNGGPTASIDPEDNHSKDALSAIAQEIESEGKPSASEINAIDDSAMPVGNEVEGNISRPDGYNQNTPGDMGVSGTNGPTDQDDSGEGDLSGILEEGLDNHAEGIQREKVIQMTSQALQQFKASKGALEAARATSPQLYQASITMLKAMIEMASLLGLGQNGELGQNTPQLGQEQASLTPQAEQNEWNEVFPAHPDNGGVEQKPGHAPSKSAEGDGSPSPQP